ncbi:hypothetical protein ACFL5V_03690 [Fibrobacterota bacterium]
MTSRDNLDVKAFVVFNTINENIFKTLSFLGEWCNEIIIADNTPEFSSRVIADSRKISCANIRTQGIKSLIRRRAASCDCRGFLFFTAGDYLSENDSEVCLTFVKEAIENNKLLLTKRLWQNQEPGEDAIVFFPNAPKVIDTVFNTSPAGAYDHSSLLYSPMPCPVRNASTKEHETAEPSLIEPLVLTGGFYRSGSTLIMELLSTSPQIAMTRFYPYEWCHLAYLKRLCSFIGRSREPQADWDVGSIVNSNQIDQLKPFPFHDSHKSLLFDYLPDGHDDQGIQNDCFLAIWKEFSKRMIAKNNNVKYYSEKHPEWSYIELKKIMPVKAIFVVRDPRDIYLSHLGWSHILEKVKVFKETGVPLQEKKDIHFVDEEVNVFIKDLKQRFTRTRKAAENPDEYIIVYEELISNIKKVCGHFHEWFGIQANPTLLNPGYLELHQTSTSVEASVCRWKSEMPERINEIFVNNLSDEMKFFGYET